MERINRPLIRAFLGAFILLFALGFFAWDLATRSFPQQSGQIVVDGLSAPVEILRSQQGVPHIYAQSDRDLFFAQGYTHAQDRFWQMDFFRHIGRGRLAEMFGSSQLETDLFLQTLGWERIAEQEFAALDSSTRQILQAYSDGVNAYLEGRRPGQISLEYVLLGILSPSYSIKPWQPVDTLTWAKSMAWDLGGNLDEEIDHAILLNQLPDEQFAALYPEYPADHPIITGGFPAAGLIPERAAGGLPRYQLASWLGRRLASMPHLQTAGLKGIGSNNWVVGPSASGSGSPLLANDTHLGIQMPSIWYENSLHCQPLSDQCHFDAAGFSFAGAPGVIIGHNNRIAWGVTNAGPDVQDLFIEMLDPAQPDRYLFEGEWLPLEITQVEVEVAGQEPASLTIRRSHHGPLITDSYGPLDDPRLNRSLPLPQDYGLALRWTALEPATLVKAILGVNRAQNWQEFRQALAFWDVPAQNFVYADVEGNIGYQLPGRIPMRRSGRGWLPQPGWTGEFEWDGYIPYPEMPSVYNPESDLIVTANNAIVNETYPYLISQQWDYGFRATRIQSLLQADEALALADLQRIQGDNQHPMARVLIPYMTNLEWSEQRLAAWVDRLQQWDGQNDLDSAEAAVFNAFWRELLDLLFTQNLGEAPLPSSSRAFVIVTQLLDEPQSSWWDIGHSARIERRDDLLRLALTGALDFIERELGNESANWRWGDLHTATFKNQSLGTSGIGPVEALFNRGPVPTSGGTSIVNATGWRHQTGFEVTSVPSQRLILDLSDWDAGQAIHTTGQSGHAFHPNYDDLIDPWRLIQYHPLPWSRQGVEAQSSFRLVLQPE
jgi:penicillin amidase